MASANVTEVARRYRERHLAVLARPTARRSEVALEVVDDLRHDTGPVDRIDRADLVARLVSVIVRHRLDDVLCVVEHAFHREVEDVRILQAVHLGRLERTHLAGRREHEDANAFLAAHGVLGRAAGVAGRRAENVECIAVLRQRILEQVAQQLHGHVLERQRRAIRERQQRELRAPFVAQRQQRRDVGRVFARTHIAVHLGGVRARRQVGQDLGRNVAREFGQHLRGQLGVRQLAPGAQLVRCHLRVLRRQIQTAIRGQAAQQNAGERLRLARGQARAARGDVFHVGRVLSYRFVWPALS